MSGSSGVRFNNGILIQPNAQPSAGSPSSILTPAQFMARAVPKPPISPGVPPPPAGSPSPKLTHDQFKVVLQIIATNGNVQAYLKKQNVELDKPLDAIRPGYIGEKDLLNKALDISRNPDLKEKAKFLFKDYGKGDGLNEVQFKFITDLLKTHTLEEVHALLPDSFVQNCFNNNVLTVFSKAQDQLYQEQCANLQTKEIDFRSLFSNYEEGDKLTDLQFKGVLNLIKKGHNLEEVFGNLPLSTKNLRSCFTDAQRKEFRTYLSNNNTPQVDHFGERVYKVELEGGTVWYEDIDSCEDEEYYHRYGFDPRNIEYAKEAFLKASKEAAKDGKALLEHKGFYFVIEDGRIIVVPKSKDLTKIKQITLILEDNTLLPKAKIILDPDTILQTLQKNADSDSFISQFQKNADPKEKKFSKFQRPLGFGKVISDIGYDPKNMASVERYYVNHIQQKKPTQEIEGYECLITKGGRVIFSNKGAVKIDDPTTYKHIKQIKLYDGQGAPLEGDSLKTHLKNFLKAYRNADFREKIGERNHFSINGQTGKCECTASFDTKIPKLTLDYSQYIRPRDKKLDEMEKAILSESSGKVRKRVAKSRSRNPELNKKVQPRPIKRNTKFQYNKGKK